MFSFTKGKGLVHLLLAMVLLFWKWSFVVFGVTGNPPIHLFMYEDVLVQALYLFY